jgi:hypothetical protein
LKATPSFFGFRKKSIEPKIPRRKLSAEEEVLKNLNEVELQEREEMLEDIRTNDHKSRLKSIFKKKNVR